MFAKIHYTPEAVKKIKKINKHIMIIQINTSTV